MAISNIQETLLMYTKQKAVISNQLSDNMMQMLNSSKQVAEEQAKYNNVVSDIYYNYYESDPENYEILIERAEQEHELSLANLNSWEQEIELEKNDLETKLNEINAYESTWIKMLQNYIKVDFSYGGVSQ